MKTIVSILTLSALAHLAQGQSLSGAWKLTDPQTANNTVMIVADGYLMIAAYNPDGKTFDYTEGGKMAVTNDSIFYTCDFNSGQKEMVGKKLSFLLKVDGSTLTASNAEEKFVWERIDDAGNDMAGTWRITERAQDGTGPLVKIHQTGTRQTYKILSGTRFEWAAFDSGNGEFSGCGGGTYEAKDGKYTEKLEFFPRDNERVGTSLSFDWKLENGRWDHSGKSSQGKPIHEIWEKVK